MDCIHKLRKLLSEQREFWKASIMPGTWIVGNQSVSEGSKRKGTHRTFTFGSLLDAAALEATRLGLDPTPLVRLERIALPVADIPAAIDAVLTALDEIELRLAVNQKAAKVRSAADAKAALRGVLRPRFEALDGEIAAVLLDFSRDLGGEEARRFCPYISAKELLPGGQYGDGQRTRLFALKNAKHESKTKFMRLADEAGNCLGPWATDFGIPWDSLTERYPSTRWMYCLFDLALRMHPGFPMDADKTLFGNIDLFFAKMKLAYAGPPEQEANELKEKVRQIESLGWYARLQDVQRASLYAIDILTAEAAPVSIPLAPLPVAEQKSEADGGTQRQKAKAKTPTAQKKPLTKRLKIRNQRNNFSRPRRKKGMTWGDIYDAYRLKYKDDTDASPDTLRHSSERNKGDDHTDN